jgi:hypothetical protein
VKFKDMRASVQRCDLPPDTVLATYATRGAYTDCYATVVPRTVTHAQYVEAFYTTWIFKLERWLIAQLLSQPSSDTDARELAQGHADSFAAWSVEQRTANQIVLAAGRTRSWLMTSPSHESNPVGTALYFGSAVLPRRRAGSGEPEMGWSFKVLLGWHKLYSWCLLGAARRRLSRYRFHGFPPPG